MPLLPILNQSPKVRYQWRPLRETLTPNNICLRRQVRGITLCYFARAVRRSSQVGSWVYEYSCQVHSWENLLELHDTLLFFLCGGIGEGFCGTLLPLFFVLLAGFMCCSSCNVWWRRVPLRSPILLLKFLGYIKRTQLLTHHCERKYDRMNSSSKDSNSYIFFPSTASHENYFGGSFKEF